MQPIQDEALSHDHRQRLLGAGVEPEVLAGIRLLLATEGLPAWWHEQGNALYLDERVQMHAPVLEMMLTYKPTEAVVVVAAGIVEELILLPEGDRATVFLGPDAYFSAAEIYCGGESSIVFNGTVSATGRCVVDARNGGSIVAAEDQLWADSVYVATDDMHRLEDLETGVRLNPFGGRIRFGRHVWLGRGSVVTGDVDLGDGCVVGIGSYVRGQKVAPNTAVAGTPARLIREGITWRVEDSP